MKPESDNEPLLDAVFSEAAPAEFRDAVLGETLRLVRRRRRWRQARRPAVLVVAGGLLLVLVWQNLPRRVVPPPTVAKAEVKNYQLVRTQPFPAGAMVVTRPLASDRLVASVATVETVQTTTGNFRALNDDELLTLIAPRPAALVRIGPHSEELVFVNPADAKGFPVN